jgi:hypothetical protein
VVLHDRKLPGSKENIDHVAVGPPGVFVVETKNWNAGRVMISSGGLTYRGRAMDREIEQAKRQMAAVERVLGTARMALRREIELVLCIHGTTVERRHLWTKPLVRGVTICSGRQLARTLTHKRLAVLDTATVNELGLHLDTNLRPKIEPLPSMRREAPPAFAVANRRATVESRPAVCPCSGTIVERRRKSDNAPFWGCSHFPRCRNTWPVETP